MKIRIIPVIIFLFLAQIINAQTDFRPGYIIPLSGDTIFGKIDYRGDLTMGKLCKFKSNDGQISDYSPNDISAYRFIDSRYFVSRELSGNKVFLEFLVKGEVNIYYFREASGDHYYLDSDVYRLIEIPYSEGIRREDGKDYYFESTKHIGILKYYMKDAPELAAKINNIKKPEHSTLISIAEDYHNAVCKDEECIVFKKKQLLFKVNFEALFGMRRFSGKVSISNNYYMQAGVIANIWMPRTNEKLYFRIGFLNTFFDKNFKEEIGAYLIPMHIGYLAPNTYKIRPSVSISLNSPSYSCGLLYKVNDKINIGVQSWIWFFSDIALWVPTKLHSYSVFGSVYIEL